MTRATSDKRQATKLTRCGECLWFVAFAGAAGRQWGYCLVGPPPRRGIDWPKVGAGQGACRNGHLPLPRLDEPAGPM